MIVHRTLFLIFLFHSFPSFPGPFLKKDINDHTEMKKTKKEKIQRNVQVESPFL